MHPGTPELDAVAHAKPPRSFGANDTAEFSSTQFVQRLLWGTLSLNLIVAALATLWLYQSYEQYQHRALVTTQNLARALEQDLSASFDKVDLAVLSTKSEVERQLASGSTNRKALNAHVDAQIARQPDLDSVRVTNAQGDVVYGTGVAANPAVNAAHRDFFNRLRKDSTDGLVISKPSVGQISGKWSIALARRINDPRGNFAGVAYAVILLERFQKKFAALDRGAHGVVSLRDLELGTVVRQPRVFNMFAQGDRARERSQAGLGIGLTLVKRLVELHGGTVEAFSKGEGQGCQFVARLPSVKATPPQPHAQDPDMLAPTT